MAGSRPRDAMATWFSSMVDSSSGGSSGADGGGSGGGSGGSSGSGSSGGGAAGGCSSGSGSGGSSGADGGGCGGSSGSGSSGGGAAGGCSSGSGSGGSGGSGGATEASPSQPAATTTSSSAPPALTAATAARKRTPGRWRRIPRELTPALIATKEAIKAREVLGIMDWEERDRWFLQKAAELEAIDANDCDSEEAKVAFLAAREQELRLYRKIARTRPEDMKFRTIEPSDTKEELLTAEEMEARFPQRKGSHVAQLNHFAKLALEHYNATKAEHDKFDLAQALTSNCFSEACGTTYAHVNFTAIPHNNQNNHLMKRLFFAELMLVPELQLYKDAEPMHVLQVSTIDDTPCFGGCHEILRRIDHRMSGVMDYERCHACREILKHPKGENFVGGHDSTRMPYYSAT